MDAVIQSLIAGFPIFMLHSSVTLAMLALGVAVYVMITPYPEFRLVRDGNLAAAISLSGAIVGIALPLAFCLAASVSLFDIVIWGSVTVVLQLVAYKVIDESSIPQSLTGEAGDPLRGREVAINRKLGNCLACHKMPIPEQQFHGEVGPDLSEVADSLSEGELRLRVVNPKLMNPETLMPAFYQTEGLHRVMKKFQGKTLLTAEQVEDVVAYLMTLKAQ